MFSCVKYKSGYKSWEDAASHSVGYDEGGILEKCKEAALKVKKSEAKYERDGVLFYEENYNYPLLYILKHYLKNDYLKLIDFGGGLASTYFQNQKMIAADFNEIKWIVLEQKHFVEFGNKNLSDDRLRFLVSSCNITDIIIGEEADVILFSSVIQYLDFADELLKNVNSSGVKMIIFERTPLCERNSFCVEIVKEPIYNASYPCRFYTKDNLLSKLSKYSLVGEWDSLYDSCEHLEDGALVEFKSLILLRRE